MLGGLAGALAVLVAPIAALEDRLPFTIVPIVADVTCFWIVARIGSRP